MAVWRNIMGLMQQDARATPFGLLFGDFLLVEKLADREF
jgi:hypothetical protein